MIRKLALAVTVAAMFSIGALGFSNDSASAHWECPNGLWSCHFVNCHVIFTDWYGGPDDFDHYVWCHYN